MSSDEFNEIVKSLSLFKLQYNIDERNRERERSYQILGICLVIMSIVIATITSEHDALTRITKHHIISIIGVSGFILILFNMALCYRMMTLKTYNPIIDPKLVYDLYKDTDIVETRKKLNATIFAILSNMDTTNENFRNNIRIIHIITPICLTAIFIPVITLIVTA